MDNSGIHGTIAVNDMPSKFNENDDGSITSKIILLQLEFEE